MSGRARVKILNDIVVNQIAAGEVVERPASVVKELLENAVDAGATEISVVIANGGRSSIEVIDNGSGMERDDALLAIERFGTSKITSVDDLMGISTHGFRGEALPSIAAVSRFQLESSTRGGVGVAIAIDGGVLKKVEDRPLPPGTKVSVKQLFYNVPARRKFLRAEATEEGMVRALIVDFALAYPQIGFSLVVDGVRSATYAPRGTLVERAREFGMGDDRPLIIDERREFGESCWRVTALLTEPIASVSSANRLRLLINRRSVRDKLLLKAVRDGYGSYLKAGRYPAGVISLDIPSDEVDVNVHPQKTEVRFRNSPRLFATVVGAIKAALRSAGLAEPESPIAQVPEWSAFERPEPYRTSFSFRPYESDAPPEVEFRRYPEIRGGELPYVAAAGTTPAQLARGRSLTAMRYVGQLLHCYLVFEGEDECALMDMHAAHERVMFYRLKRQFLSGAVVAQGLLLPESMPLPADRSAWFVANTTQLNRLGFDLEIDGPIIRIRSLPALLAGIAPRTLVGDLLALDVEESGASSIEGWFDAALARLACHRSIRSGRDLEPEEAVALAEILEEVDASGFCPHGRPVVKRLTRGDLELLFGRRE